MREYIRLFQGLYEKQYGQILEGKYSREHSPFVTIIIDVATGWLFENGYAKEAARYFQTA